MARSEQENEKKVRSRTMATAAQTRTPPTRAGLERWRRLQPLFWLACLAGVVTFPFIFSNPAQTTVAFFTLVFAASGTAWNVFSGYTGYIALGHAVFFGLGAYTLALAAQRWSIPGGFGLFALVPVAGLVAAVFAVPLGIIALRTRRHTFVVITIAFLFIFQLLAYNLRGLTGGSAGLEYPMPTWSGDVFNLPFYYVMVVILLLAVGTSWFVRHSKYGLELLAIRDDEERALGLGVRTGLLKLSAFTLSGFFVGMCGAVWGYFIGSIYPNTGFDANFDVVVALMAFLGGLGTIIGPLLGALIIIPMQQYLGIYLASLANQNSGIPLLNNAVGLYLVLYGALFIVVILLLPQGIVPALAQLIHSRFGARDTTPVAPEAPRPAVQPAAGGTMDSAGPARAVPAERP